MIFNTPIPGDKLEIIPTIGGDIYIISKVRTTDQIDLTVTIALPPAEAERLHRELGELLHGKGIEQ